MHIKTYSIINLIVLYISVGILTGCLKSEKQYRNRIEGLREGSVYVRTEKEFEEIVIAALPEYGWKEKILIFGPDGQLFKSLDANRKKCEFVVQTKDIGDYRILLKPSYSYDIYTSANKMVYMPVKNGAGLFRNFSDHSLYFPVEDGNDITLLYSNHRGYKGSSISFDLRNEEGKSLWNFDLDSFSVNDVLDQQEEKLNKKGLDRSDTNFIKDPYPPTKKNFLPKKDEFWSVKLGGFISDDSGFWALDKDLYLCGSPENFFVPNPYYSQTKIEIEEEITSIPLVGCVGWSGTIGSEEDKTFTNLNLNGDKFFALQVSDEKETHGDLIEYNWRRHKMIKNQRPDLKTLYVLKSMSPKYEKLPLYKKFKAFEQWTDAICSEIRKNPNEYGQKDRFVIQPLHEPNLSKTFDEYLPYLKSAGRAAHRLEMKVGGAALGSGKEQSLLDYDWYKNMLIEADEYVDAVIWNTYRVRELEDTYLYNEMIEDLTKIIQVHDRDNHYEPLILGATNRKGGLVDSSIFSTWESSLWWASLLYHVAGHPNLEQIYHYRIKDVQIRKKGFLKQDGTLKPIAHTQKLFSDFFKKQNIRKIKQNHSMLEGFFSDESFILIHKGDGIIDLDLSGYQYSNLVLFNEESYVHGEPIHTSKDPLTLPPYSIISGTWSPTDN